MFNLAWDWLARRIVSDQLHRLDDRLLADMGFERDLIDLSIRCGEKLHAETSVPERDQRSTRLGAPSACGPLLARYASAGH